MALTKYQHMWLKSLEEGAKSVRVISFEFSKAFDNAPHEILLKKIKKIPINTYITSWLIDFLHSLLPSKLIRPLRQRGHDFELPIVKTKTERFKNVFINRCLFNFI